MKRRFDRPVRPKIACDAVRKRNGSCKPVEISGVEQPLETTYSAPPVNLKSGELSCLGFALVIVSV